MRRVAILGAGVAGLAAAARIGELAAEHETIVEVDVYDRAVRPGGCVQTLREDGLVLELGADSLLVDKPAARRVIERFNLASSVLDVNGRCAGARIVRNGRLRPLPANFRLFSPTSFRALVSSGIFSAAGMARAAFEPLVPKRSQDADESVASFVQRRFGREVLERLAQPLVGGIYSGDPRALSMEATLPQFREMERRYGSVFRGMRALPANAAAPRLASFRDGVGSIPEAFAGQLAAHIHTGRYAQAIQRTGTDWIVRFADGTSTRADAIICALPAYETARVLRQTDEQLAAQLERIRYNSIATVNLVYVAEENVLPESTGFVVPFAERRRITAATFTTQKYAHRAPHGTTIVRAFIGGALQPQLLDMPDDELVNVAREEVAQLTGLRVPVERARIARWERMLPEYAVGHVQLVEGIQRRAGALAGFALAGSAYRGVGIPDCMQTGTAAAESVFGYIAATGTINGASG